MGQITRSVKHSSDLDEAVEARWKLLGYKSQGAYDKALKRYDLMVQGHHKVTLAIANAPQKEQHKVDRHLNKLTKKGVGVKGCLLDRIVERVIGRGNSLDDQQAVMKVLLEEATWNSSQDLTTT